MVSSDVVSGDTVSEDVISENSLFGHVEEVTFISWEDAGLEDHVMDWQDESLEAAIREEIIHKRDIMLSDVWEITDQ